MHHHHRFQTPFGNEDKNELNRIRFESASEDPRHPRAMFAWRLQSAPIFTAGVEHLVVFSSPFTFPLFQGRTMFRTLSFALLVGLTGLAANAEDSKSKFTPLFNGKDLTGWQVVANKDKDKAGESTDGKAETPTKRFVAKDGNLVIDPKVKGDLVLKTAKAYGGDAHVKFEFKPGEACNNDLYFRGQKFDIKKDPALKMKDGEWNLFEIVVVGADGEFKCNGETVKKFKAKPDATPFGIRAEFGAIEFRNLQITAKE